jgi:hypothetical protein
MKYIFRLLTGIFLGSVLLTPDVGLAQGLSDLSEGMLQAEANAEARELLSEGMLYAEARELLIDAGWQPMVVRRPDPIGGTVARMVNELGYGEVVDCSGTGRGFCLFSFVNAEDQKLSITTVNNQTGQAPTVAGWRIEENAMEQ